MERALKHYIFRGMGSSTPKNGQINDDVQPCMYQGLLIVNR